MKTVRQIIDYILKVIGDTCTIWLRELRNTFKDEGMLIFFILVPLGYPLLYSWIYNNEVVRDVPVAIVDMSHSHASRRFIEKFDASPDTRAAFYCNSLEEAKDLVGRQQVHGVLYFPEDFERRIGRGEQALVDVYCDMSLMLTYKAIYQSSQSVAFAMSADIQKPKAGGTTIRDDELNTEPIAVEKIQMFNSTGGYGNALLPAVLILILQQTLLLGIGLSAGTARENRDMIGRSVYTDPTTGGILPTVTGKALCYFMIYCIMAAYITLCVPRMFHFTSLVHAADLIGLMIPFLLSAIFFGMMLSSLVRYRENVLLLVVFTSVPFLFMSGISWPHSNIPGFWQGVSWLIPSTFGIRGFLKTSSMGATFQDIVPEVRALWIQAIVYFAATFIITKLKQAANRD